MNPEFSIGKLRKIAGRLRQLPYDRSTYYNATVAPQEALDYLCMLSGVKPAYLLGRGFDDVNWARGIAALSKELGVHVRIGVTPEPYRRDDALPEWYRAWLEEKARNAPVIYISRYQSVADRIGAFLQAGALSPEEEAALLGFPACCVREHHATHTRVERAEYALLRRAGNDDPEAMKHLLKSEHSLTPETEEEHVSLNPDGVLSPFTSFFMCAACQFGRDTPAQNVSDRQRRLAKRIDPNLYQALKTIGEESPVYRPAAGSG